jgi:hypothetical protein
MPGMGEEISGFRSEFGIWSYKLRPKYKGKSPSEIRSIVSAGCSGWASDLPAMQWPRDLLVGGIEPTSDAPVITKASALESIFRTASRQAVMDEFELSELQACQAINQWIDLLPETVAAQNEALPDGVKHYGLSSNSFDDFLSQFEDADPVLIVLSYLIMVGYAAVSLLNCDPVHSRVGLGLAGIVNVALAVLSAPARGG